MPTDLSLALAPLRDEAEGGEGTGRLLLIGTKVFFFWEQSAYFLPDFLEPSNRFWEQERSWRSVDLL